MSGRSVALGADGFIADYARERKRGEIDASSVLTLVAVFDVLLGTVVRDDVLTNLLLENLGFHADDLSAISCHLSLV